MIGRFMVAMATIQNIQSMIVCVMLQRTFVPSTSITSMGRLTFKLEMFQYLVRGVDMLSW